MFRFLIGLLFLSSCSLGVIQSGGEKTYVYDVQKEYTVEELSELSTQVITTKSRDPQKGKLEDLFSKNQPPIKRIGILVFESTLQPTRSGLSTEDKVFLSEQGKQLLTEKLLSIWEQSFSVLGEGIEYVPVSKVKKSKAYQEDGLSVTDYVLSKRDSIMPDDIFYLPTGKKTAIPTVLNPRGMRDLSLALVPASELMAGPKFSEHAKHTLNSTAKELNLDAMLIIGSEISWTAAHIDKHSGESFADNAIIRLTVTTAVPLSKYHERLNNIGEKRDQPNNTVSYRYYESKIKIPVDISVPEAQQTFDHIEKTILTPSLKTYNDLTHMTQLRVLEDIRMTHK